MTAPLIRILLCDDQSLVSEGLHLILETDPVLQVVGVAADGQAALTLAAQTTPDIVLMDLKMPIMNGVQATAALRRLYPALPVLILTTFDDDEWVMDAVRSGAAGYLLKDTPRDRLIAAVKETVAGRTHLDPAIAGKLIARLNTPQAVDQPASPRLAMLNEREREVLRLIADGLTNSEIAGRLFLSEGTVRNYVSAVLAKLDVQDRTQAAVLALRYGLGG